MPRGNRSLHDIYLKEHADDNQVRMIMHQMALLTISLHENNIIHSDMSMLNVLRVQDSLRLIDLESATPVGQSIAGKRSSSILPPELFYRLKNDEEINQYTNYWRDQPDGNSGVLWAKVRPKQNWVVRSLSKSDRDCELPFEPATATFAIDMWALGVMMYELLACVELVRSDRNLDVDDNAIEQAATWTVADLSKQVHGKISDPRARDLILKLLSINPNDRISAKAMLDHDYFKESPSSKPPAQDTQERHINALEFIDLDVQTSRDTLQTLGTLKESVLRDILPAKESSVPASFVLFPFAVHDKQGVENDIEEIIDFLDKINRMGPKFMKAVRANKSIDKAVKLVESGQPIYLYLIDEIQGTIVVPKETDVYPIRIDTDTNEYPMFMAAVMPYLQTGFQFLKGRDALTSLVNSLGLSMDDKLSCHVDRMDQIKASVFKFDFQIVHNSIQAFDETLPLHAIRSVALQELERFFNKHDKSKDYSGLERTYSSSGQVLWTIKSLDSPSKRSSDRASPNAKKDLKVHKIYAQLLHKAQSRDERKVVRTPGAVSISKDVLASLASSG
ncbi:unnamed protein product [Aphanomyces euteiches]